MTTRPFRRRSKHQLRTPNALGDFIWLNALLLVGVASVWPLFEHAWLLVVVGVALLVGNMIGWLSCLHGWAWWRTIGAVLLAYLLLGVPVAAPEVWRAPAAAPSLAQSVLTAPVTGWKDILTLDLPLGTYQATLAPIFLLMLVAPVLMLTLAWKTTRAWPLAVVVGLGATVVGIMFGSSAPWGSLSVGSVLLIGINQLIIGVVALLCALGWLVWRSWSQRTAALRLPQKQATAQLRTRASYARLGRVGLATTMVVVALAAGIGFAPKVLAGETRDVLRTNVDPVLLLQQEISPLANYREFFDDETYETVLFEVAVSGETAVPGQPDRVRLATLPFYDGITANAVSPSLAEHDASTAFRRVPSALQSTRSEKISAEITVGSYRGIWVPIVSELRSIAFTGPERSALSDGFFFNQESATGIQLAQHGLPEGARYRLEATVNAAEPQEVASFTPARSEGSFDAAIVPEALAPWVGLQQVSPDGAGLLELIDRLRARGFLSHSLMLDEQEPAAWSSDLGAYAFESSRAGHSTDRINSLFTDLLDREEEIGSEAPDKLLVAAVGDDEQFAMAAALLADSLGFDTRVAVGAKLSTDDPTGIAPCVAGVCTGQNMTVWIEVRDAATGAWAPIDVTPQHEHPPSPEVKQQSDPLNQTEVEPEQPEIVSPPDANPNDSAGQDDQQQQQNIDLSWLWGLLRVTGIVLGILLFLAAPFLLIILTKLLRRKSRKQEGTPAQKMVGGWDELVDAAVDLGNPFPTTQTRAEIAKLYGVKESAMPALAAVVDRAVFSAQLATSDDADLLWQQLDRERAVLAEQLTRWQRLRSAVSLRSLRHGLHRLRNSATIEEQRRTQSAKTSVKQPTSGMLVQARSSEGEQE